MNYSNIDRVLRLSEVKIVTGLSKASIYRLMHDSDFPKPFKIGLKAVGWRESVLVDYINKKSTNYSIN